MLNYASLFTGIGGFERAFKNVFGDSGECVFFSEIDKFAIQSYLKNFPEMKNKNLGNIERAVFDIGPKKRLIPNEFRVSCLPEIDLLFGGSPCQDLSISKGDREGLDGEKSRLFFAFLEILLVKKPKYFLLENVGSMSKESERAISTYLGVEPVRLNSRNFSAQKRDRLYWFNWDIDKEKLSRLVAEEGIHFDSILEQNISEEDYPSINLSNPNLSSVAKQLELHKYNTEKLIKGLAWSKSTRYPKDREKYEENRVSLGKANTLTTGSGCGNQSSRNYVLDNGRVRNLTSIECERLHCFPDNWTLGVSRSQRYKQLGNSVTVSVIQFIFSALKKELENE